MNRLSIYSMTTKNWNEYFSSQGFSTTIVPYWLEGLYKNPKIWENHLSTKLLSQLQSSFEFSLPEITSYHESLDGTVKFLVKFTDGLEVETVLLPFNKRHTICLSTQVGCGMNCQFCYTGTQGLKRNLTSSEIVGQYMVVTNWHKNRDPQALNPSIVFMGQGEPLHNLDEVKQAISVLNDPLIFGIGHRQITLSTVGHLPAMGKLIDFPRINLALSLHSPFQEERTKLIPVNERFPLEKVLEALDKIPLLSSQFIVYEYILIKDFNMFDRHVEALHELLSHRKAIVNLIPFNPFPGSQWERPSLEMIEDFKEKLVAKKLRVMLRETKGSDVLAACGQLKIKKLERRYESK